MFHRYDHEFLKTKIIEKIPTKLEHHGENGREGRSWYRPRTSEKVQNTVADKFKKDDTLIKKTKGTGSTGKETVDQEVVDDEVEAVADGVENGGVQ